MNKAIVYLLVLNGLAAQTIINGGRTILGPLDASQSTATLPARKGAGAPAGNCMQAELYFRTDAAAGQNLYFCTATNTWTQMGGGSGGQALLSGGSYWLFGTPMGDGPSVGSYQVLQVYYNEFTQPFSSLKISRIILYNYGTEAGKYATAGIYDSACNLLAQAETLSMAAAGAKVFNLPTPVTLTNALYYFAFSTDSTAVSIHSNQSGGYNAILNADGVQRTFEGSNPATLGGTAINLPASCGTKLPNARSNPTVMVVP